MPVMIAARLRRAHRRRGEGARVANRLAGKAGFQHRRPRQGAPYPEPRAHVLGADSPDDVGTGRRTGGGLLGGFSRKALHRCRDDRHDDEKSGERCRFRCPHSGAILQRRRRLGAVQPSTVLSFSIRSRRLRPSACTLLEKIMVLVVRLSISLQPLLASRFHSGRKRARD